MPKISDFLEESTNNSINNVKLDNLDLADETVDQLNNTIGRSLATPYTCKQSLKDTAKLVLQEFHRNGLFIAKLLPNGRYIVKKEKLSDNKYYDMLFSLEKINNQWLMNGDESETDWFGKIKTVLFFIKNFHQYER